MLPRVLLVEDDEVLREIYALKFELVGFDIAVAENGQVGLAKIPEFQPHIVLLDMMMPIMDGQEFLERLGPKAHQLDIIIFSNIATPHRLAAFRKLGAKEYWVKSDFTPDRVAVELLKRWEKQRSGQRSQ